MSTYQRTGQKSTGTTQRWTDLADNSQLVPEDWAASGEREEATDGEQLYFAVEVRPGLLLEYRTDERGEPTGVATREEPGLRTLYVRADGGRAIVLESAAEGDETSIAPAADWPAVIARDAVAGNEVAPSRREKYRTLIRDRYPEVEN